MNVISAGVLLSVWLLVPFFRRVAELFSTRWRAAYTVGGLLAACGFLSVFIIHFGNRQFGAWDFGVLIDTGWRQILGQRPYTDFISPLPPGFNLGIKYAFELFLGKLERSALFHRYFCVNQLPLELLAAVEVDGQPDCLLRYGSRNPVRC